MFLYEPGNDLGAFPGVTSVGIGLQIAAAELHGALGLHFVPQLFFFGGGGFLARRGSSG